ncbi:oligomycin resistance ATP-dependent permease yor1 [Penicillium frequentans]|uniref:Oligomycin resistance ATP-dependent permease yor1 n=1 Tax=Penicillium frequentans TaxID=3151616 RepID=A0AAD6CI30_9EURO|nr:oligomycin resistance ATP-dependent permease yor1 [Penicillium glabrum]
MSLSNADAELANPEIKPSHHRKVAPTGFRRPLKINDIPLLNPTRSVQRHSVTFDAHFKEAKASSDVKHPLFTALHKTFAREFWIGGLCRLLADLFTVGNPYTLRYLIEWVQNSYYAHLPGSTVKNPGLTRGVGLLVGIICMQILLSSCQNHFLYRGTMVGGQVRAVLTNKIQEKSLRISERARAGGSADLAIGSSETTLQEVDLNEKPGDAKPPKSSEKGKEADPDAGWSNGRVVNLVSMDAHRIDSGISMIHVVWTSPLIIFICMALLIVNLRQSALAGFGVLIVSMFFLVVAVKALFARRQVMNIATDVRVGLTQEVLQAIRLVKYFSWEDSFVERLIAMRADETRQLQGFNLILNFVTSLGQSLPVLACMVSFVTYACISTGGLDVAIVFSSVALFSSLLTPTAFLPACLGHASDAWASMTRIEEYLLAEEVEELDVDENMRDAVRIEKAGFTWEKGQAARATDLEDEAEEEEDPQGGRNSLAALRASRMFHDGEINSYNNRDSLSALRASRMFHDVDYDTEGFALPTFDWEGGPMAGPSSRWDRPTSFMPPSYGFERPTSFLMPSFSRDRSNTNNSQERRVSTFRPRSTVRPMSNWFRPESTVRPKSSIRPMSTWFTRPSSTLKHPLEREGSDQMPSLRWEDGARPSEKGSMDRRASGATISNPPSYEESSSAVTLAEELPILAPFSIPSISLNIRRGELLAVIGGIGSGKSSLLSALAGDMRKVQGSLKFYSDRAYCPQTAWIQNATVRDNILFGAPYDAAWYDEVITACQLRRDLQILSNGDATEIGERGINVSGGQKQRISLARAMYSNADILLLDDPLSAVDPYVGQAIFEKAILGALGSKTRILATHQAHVLSRCDRILWLDDGKVKALGSFAKLKKKYPDFAALVKEAEGNREKATKEDAEKDASKPEEETTTTVSKLAGDDSVPELMQSEDDVDGGISWAVYTSYLACSRSPIAIILAIPLLCLAQGSALLCGMWLAWWASDRFGFENNTYIGIYVALGVCQALCLYLFGLCISILCTSASNVMLDKATEKIMRAPVWFFDTTPLGRIVNRFSKDVYVMDDALPESLRLFMVGTAMVLGILSLIVSEFHWFGIALVPCTAIFFFSAFYYRASARELKRHESVLRGVVLARFSETLSGVTTIRTYSMQKQFSKSMQHAIDDMNSANFLTSANQRWLGIRLDFVGVLLIVAAGVLVVIQRSTQNPAISGVVLSYSLGAAQVLQFIIRQWANVENAMNATERIHAYGPGNSLPVEGNNGTTPVPAPESWPEQGGITFGDVHMRYREGLPNVLRGLTLSIKPGEHVAIVGRTGAGKSSLIGALFRTCELSGGCITIDGVDISTLPLKDLRSRLSIQPQDSILFRGTVRTNLDPLKQHTDEELWLALRGAWLAETVQLDDVVEEEGSNFSHGQRQQLGLARLLVRNSKVVVCDEATSSVDLETDEKIQRTMVEAFKGKTVITVAHRIRTIINYDRVCVMDKGAILELGTPSELWDLGGVFMGMCETSGIAEEELQRFI